MSRVCLKCNKSRETVKVERADPHKKGRYWRVEVCPTCGFNFDLEEVTRAIEPKKNKPDDDRYFGKPRGGWLV